MKLKESYIHILPLLCLVAGFVLVNLCLFAGNKPGFMEEYALIRIDLSSLGKNLFVSDDDDDKNKNEKEDKEKAKDKDDDDDDDDDGGGFGSLIGDAKDKISDKIGDAKDKVGDKIDGAKDKIGDKITDIGNGLADRLIDKLGVEDWYSLHILTFCQGAFENVTDQDARPGFEVKNCTQSVPGDGIDLNSILGSSLSSGSLDLSLSDLSFPPAIQRQLARLNRALHAVFGFYVATVALAGLAILSNAAAIFLPPSAGSLPEYLTAANFALAGLAAVAIALGSLVTTAAAVAATEAVGDLGELIGVKTELGVEFVKITWAAVGVLCPAAAYWGWRFGFVWKDWKEVRAIRGEKGIMRA